MIQYNPYFVVVSLIVIAIGLIYYIYRFSGRRRPVQEVVLDKEQVEAILLAKVRMFQKLDPEDRSVFIDRVLYFLKTTKISAEKGAVVTDEDRVLVAASGTIPLFHFKHWAYENLDEVLIYPSAFTEHFDTEEASRNIAGMVGTGALNHKMLLSLDALRAGFQKYPEGNTAIHEFVHLIDKADGEIDGIPEYLIPKELIDPWLHEMDKTIKEIRSAKSDIRDYAATNHAEFLAVVSEYFFKKPDQLKHDHPRLYEILDEIYNQNETNKLF